MIEKVIAWLNENKAQYPNGINDSEISVVSRYIEDNYEITLPDAYSEFLKRINGFFCDTYCLYCYVNEEIKRDFPFMIPIDILLKNKEFADVTESLDYYILGDSSMEYAAYDIKRQKYVLLTVDSLRLRSECDNFDDLLISFIGL